MFMTSIAAPVTHEQTKIVKTSVNIYAPNTAQKEFLSSPNIASI